MSISQVKNDLTPTSFMHGLHDMDINELMLTNINPCDILHELRTWSFELAKGTPLNVVQLFRQLKLEFQI